MNEAVDFKIVEEPKKPISMHPKKFGLWLFMASVFILFMAFTSAYIVRRAEGNWQLFELPKQFLLSTAVIVLSSVTMQMTYLNAKKGLAQSVKSMVLITTILGLAFLILQWLGWKDMVGHSVYLVGNPSLVVVGQKLFLVVVVGRLTNNLFL